MAILHKKTKRGLFQIEFGSRASNNNKARTEETLEDYYRRTTPASKKVEEAYQLFINYHLSNGAKKRELRLDRTFVEFGRKKS